MTYNDCKDGKCCKTMDDFPISKLKHPKPQEILLECGSGTGSRIFTSANVSIDTTHFHNPIVNIEFSSIVSFVLTGDYISIQLRYELFRSCDNRSPISVGVWELFRAINAEGIIEKTETFNFTFCEYLLCPGCCDYFVTVTALEVISLMGQSTVTVSNGRIAALAQESKYLS